MKVAQLYSHNNAHEYITAHCPSLWADVEAAIRTVDPDQCRTTRANESAYDARLMKRVLSDAFVGRGWRNQHIDAWVTADPCLARRLVELPAREQRAAIIASGRVPVACRRQTNLVKDRVAVGVQFGKHSSAAYGLFVKHLAFYVGDQIDVGIEIMPMKSLQREMSSGVPYYEGEFYNVIRQGRGVPAVPLVLIGIEP